MRSINFRGGYEFDPESYATGGGLPGMLRRAMQQQSSQQQGDDFRSGLNGAPIYNEETFGGLQSGLLRGLRVLQAEQGQYQPIADPGERALSLPRDPDFRQLSRVPNDAPPSTADTSPETASRSARQLEADQAQQAREAAAARMARSVRSTARAEAESPDSADIVKSAGIGLAHGTINTLGLPGEIATGFGYLPNNLLLRKLGLKFTAGDPDFIRQYLIPEAMQQLIEGYTPAFYQPKTRAGRFAETIGEFVPAILGEAGLAARGGPAAAAALRELPGTIVKHAVAPGIVVQGLEEAYPKSWAGEALKKAYPVARRVLPVALAAKKYFSR